jgi:flavin reductase (DIM6/NTAB) family NADH-FMN oxidoreductase RutF
MQLREIPFGELRLPVFTSWNDDSFLLTSGDFASGQYNPMTVGWGAFGCMWSKPMALVVVRPHRYTYGFMEKHSDFTLCHLPPEHQDKLDYCGSHSGRKGNKVAGCGLTPIASRRVSAPGFAEADLIIECRKMYFDDFDPDHFLAGFIAGNYPAKDYHRLYLGEMRAVFGSDRYRGS